MIHDLLNKHGDKLVELGQVIKNVLFLTAEKFKKNIELIETIKNFGKELYETVEEFEKQDKEWKEYIKTVRKQVDDLDNAIRIYEENSEQIKREFLKNSDLIEKIDEFIKKNCMPADLFLK